MEPSPQIEVPFGGYFLLRRLAVGGMAEIYLARPRGAAADDFIVVKRLLNHISDHPGLIQMFLDEARIATTLDHPNIVRLFNVGTVGNQFFLSMEHLIGLDLAKINREFNLQGRAMALEHVLGIGQTLARALHYAHNHRGRKGEPLGIVHRDLSPHNVLLTFEGDVKLLDFGVAKAANALHKTRTGAFIGKLGYMSPEQCVNADELDGRSDLFSLGIILWELALGRRLYSVKKLGEYEVLRRITSDPPPDPRDYDPDVPPVVVELLNKAMAKDPADRFQSGAEFAEAIEKIGTQRGYAFDLTALSNYLSVSMPEAVERVTSSIPKLEHTPSLSRGTPSALSMPGTGTSHPTNPGRRSVYSSFDHDAKTDKRQSHTPKVTWTPLPVADTRVPAEVRNRPLGLYLVIGLFVLLGVAAVLGYFLFG